MKRVSVLCGLLMSAVASVALAVPTVNAGNHFLQPNQPNQTVQITVSGGEQVSYVVMYVQVADGGPAAGGSVVGPAITGLDVLTGTIFASNNTGDAYPDGQVTSQLWSQGTITSSGTVAATGLLATVTLDTTGFSTGTWDFMAMTSPGTGSLKTQFDMVDADIINGSITIVPEPAALSLLVTCGALLGRRRQVA